VEKDVPFTSHIAMENTVNDVCVMHLQVESTEINSTCDSMEVTLKKKEITLSAFGTFSY
jgi:nucleoid DNA-binding protein